MPDEGWGRLAHFIETEAWVTFGVQTDVCPPADAVYEAVGKDDGEEIVSGLLTVGWMQCLAWLANESHRGRLAEAARLPGLEELLWWEQ
jgi:hypothetical protein